MIHLQDLATATGGRILGTPLAQHFSGFAFDSRTVQPGELFLAVVTETGDGHDYIDEAIAAGATGVLCQTPPDYPLGATCIVVRDTQQALLDYAAHVLRERQVRVVGVTGSVGKTSTKEAAAQVLSFLEPVFRNQGNYSGRYGLPIALGDLDDTTRLAVLEMAADRFGEIRDLAQITRPQIGVVTSISHSHLAYFGSLDEIAGEKGHLVRALPPDGVAVLNADDERVRAMARWTEARVITFGLGEHADVRGTHVTVAADGTTLDVTYGTERIRASIPYLGAHHAYTALAAFAVGLSFGLSLEQISQALSLLAPIPGRTRLLPGIHGATLLDDSYNASPTSAQAALDLLAALPAKRRLLLLGEMSELGAYAQEGHRQVGQHAAGLVDVFIAKGEWAALAAQVVTEKAPSTQVQVVYSDQDAIRFLEQVLQPGDCLLIKGSASARLEEVTQALLANPERDRAKLPRQSAGWSSVRLQRPGRPTWVDIDLGAIARNVRWIKEAVGADVRVLAVLKADGYGHGALKVARTALNNGASWLGLACLGEAIALREAGLTEPMLVLGYTPLWQAREAVLHDIAVTLFDLDTAQALARAAHDLRHIARAHVKVDTGMGRLGLLPDEAFDFMRQASALDGLQVQGLFTHFAIADGADLAYTQWQIDQFNHLLDALTAAGLRPPLVHAANSAATLRLPQSHYDMVRLGIAMYGLAPSADCPLPQEMMPALTFSCQVAQVKTLPGGSYIGYGCTYRTTRESRIAVIPVGYADGFRRAPRHWGHVLVRGQYAPLVGRVCMDQTMIDVTDIPGVRQGDEVVLIGCQGEQEITVEQVAERLGTINYEVVSEILARVPRLV